ncbi:uncharacterized protein LOC128254532 [Drosophila gunungcola]|uniref:Uncharacterized protein n=1 Tax=Drosophila gunungcola TaxID=103775 RepID=A0A9P9YKT5_9MUSC|nr:uncharacterized protein LOC128254532 [Drosophila gunungcola]KAI8038845.1 hypothetical protein M5D96_008757 [Drosophila gunungcola]
MVRLEGCCYFFGLRYGCIIGGLWLILYYALLTYLMSYEMKYSRHARLDLKSYEHEKETHGFWVLGTTFFLMDLISLFLVIGAIMKRSVIIFIFLLGQIVPMSVECFYLLTAIIYGIKTEFCIIYLVPLFILVYIDLVTYAYWYELKSLKRLRAVSELHIDY